jgi:Spy/CpxP family protein refolding chaperone
MFLNRKALALVAGSIAGSALLFSPIFNHSASAQSMGDGDRPTMARNIGEMTPEKMEQRLQKMAKELNLTPDQVTKLRDLKTRTRTQLDGVLSADQKATIKATLQAKKGMKAALQAANVTEAQRNDMKKIRQDSKTALAQILTPDQLTKMKEKMKAHRGHHKGHNQSSNQAG